MKQNTKTILALVSCVAPLAVIFGLVVIDFGWSAALWALTAVLVAVGLNLLRVAF